MEHTQQPQKKHFSEEEALDKMEGKIDALMEKVVKKSFIHRFIQWFFGNAFVKKVLNHSWVNETEHKLQPYLKTIFMVVGWISIITGIVGIFSFLVALTSVGFMFTMGIGLGFRVLIAVLLAIVFALISLFMGIGMLRYKKRVPSFAILGFAVSAVSFLIGLIPVGLYSFSSYGSFGSGIFNLLVTAVLLVLIIKNERLFTK